MGIVLLLGGLLILVAIAANQKITFLPPVPGKIGSGGGVGMRKNHDGVFRLHTGVDLIAKQGDPIKAAASGIVTMSQDLGNYGEMVEVDHGDGWKTRYGHMSKRLAIVPAKVAAGQVIGLVGNTGRSDGPHLHFEIFHNGKIVDPERFMKLR